MGKFATLFESAERLDEALRKVGEYSQGNRKATIHKDNEWEEFRVKHHEDGVHQKDADYHTSDKEDAHNTAKSWVSKAKTSNESTQVDELSKEKLQDYKIAAKADKWDHAANVVHGVSKEDEFDKVQKREKGIDAANKRLVNTESQEVLEDKESRSEFTANQALSGQHHVYVSTRGKKKSIAGPFHSKEAAEAHPARKFGDGVATSDQLSK